MKSILLLTFLISFKLIASPIGGLDFIGERNIHGEDERTPVLNTSVAPYSSIGYLSGGCTGTLIAPNAVLTAGHCLYNYKDKKFITSLDFSPQVYDNFHYTKGIYRWERAFLLREFVETNDYALDFAVVILDRDVDLPHLKIGSIKDLSLEDRVFFAGYPGDKKFLSPWQSSCVVESLGPVMEYPCDSFGGMSGSAIFKAGEADTIYGIHVAGGVEINFGKGFDRAAVRKIKEWLKNIAGSSSIEMINPTPKHHKIFVKSQCETAQQFALTYLNLDDRVKKKPTLKIRPEETIYVADTRYSSIMIGEERLIEIPIEANNYVYTLNQCQ